MKTILAIDQSTSATKAILFDETGKVIDKCSRDHKQIYPQPGWVEHDAEEIWQNLLGVMNELLARPAITNHKSQIQNLSITNQRETIVIFERATGKPLHHALVWQDRRGDELCAQLRSEGKDKVVSQKTGLKIDSYFSASKLAWMVKNLPGIAAKLQNGQALIGTIDAYLIYRLTGGKVFATDATNACRTLLFNIATMKWDDELCAMFSVPLKALPQVRDSTASFGQTTFDGVLANPITIRGVMGDSQAALLAQRCLVPGSAKVTLGTGSSILVQTGSQLKFAAGTSVSTVAWMHENTPTYCLEGIINYSAATIAWLKEQLGLIKDAAETEAIAQSIPDNGGVYLVPAFAGLSAPHWSPDARAAIVGMSGHTNKAHIVRAALESIAYQIRDVLDAMQSGAGIKIAAIHADGGATRNTFLMQFLSDIIGLEVRVSRMPDCSALGAVMAGLVGSGHVASLSDLAKLPMEISHYRPTMSGTMRSSLCAGWSRAVKQVLAGAG